MQLIDRYIEAVKFWLPKAQQEDIAAELHANLLSQAEEKEAELGRPLEEEEEAAILKQLGPPPLVAARYRPDQGTVAFGRELIGPLLYPYYRVAVKVTLSILALLELLRMGAHMAISFSNLTKAIMQAAWQLLDVAVVPLLAVTIVFAVIDHALQKYRLADKWDPRRLAPVKHQKQVVPRANSLAGLVVQVVFIVWWLSLPDFSEVTFGQIRPTPIWQTLYLPMLVIAFVTLAQHGVTLLRPSWAWVVPAFGLSTAILSLIIIYPLAQTHPLALLQTTDPTPLAELKLGKLNAGLHWAVLYTWIGILIYALVAAVKCFRAARDLFARQHQPSVKPVANGGAG